MSADEVPDEPARIWVARDSPGGDVGLVFEDDGETGWLYVVGIESEGDPEIRKAIWIYDGQPNIEEEDVEILWTEDGSKGALAIKQRIWAVVDTRTGGHCSVPYREGVEPVLLPDMLSGFPNP